MVKIIHYRKNCIGCNSCIEIDPLHWKINYKDGKALLKGGKSKRRVYRLEITEFEKEDSKKAAESCPVNVIKIED